MDNEIEQAKRETELLTRKEIAQTLGEKGLGVYEISEIVHIEPNTVREWLGMRKKFAYREDWHFVSQTVRELYREGEIDAIKEIAPNLVEMGLSVAEIAKVMGEDEQTIRECLKPVDLKPAE